MRFDHALIIRSASVLGPLLLSLVWVLLGKPTLKQRQAGVITSLWLLPSLLYANRLAVQAGGWSFQPGNGGSFLGLPFDLMLGWTWLWGCVWPLVFARRPVWLALVAALWLDVVGMPLLAPVLVLHPSWLLWDGVLLVTCLLPALVLQRWIVEGTYVASRAWLYMLSFAGYLFWLLPQMVWQVFPMSWEPVLARPTWVNSLLLQLGLLPLALGIAAVREFVQVGQGTPIPWDAPSRLVTTGPYAYVRNPMQLSTLLMFGGLALGLHQAIFLVGGLLLVAYTISIAMVCESRTHPARFGEDWQRYGQQVRNWFPRAVPYSAGPPAQLYIAETCGPCQEVQHWFATRHPVGLTLCAAEAYPQGSLTRITYVGPAGHVSTGVAAVYQALNHLHLGWAVLGWILRLPLLCQVTQLLVDACGGGPRRLGHHPAAHGPACHQASARGAASACTSAARSASSRT